jgi:hypothetical protein
LVLGKAVFVIVSLGDAAPPGAAAPLMTAAKATSAIPTRSTTRRTLAAGLAVGVSFILCLLFSLEARSRMGKSRLWERTQTESHRRAIFKSGLQPSRASCSRAAARV